MTNVLLVIIAACLLFGSAAVLGFLEIAFWLILVLAAVLIAGLVVWGLMALARPENEIYDTEAQLRARARTDGWEAWIAESRRQREQKRREQERQEQERQEQERRKQERWEQERREWDHLLEEAWQQDVTDDDSEHSLARRASDLLCTLRAVNRELGKSAGRPLRPEMTAGVRRLLRENPDHREYILNELRRNYWCVDGL